MAEKKKGTGSPFENMWSELSRLSKSWFEGDREQDLEYRSYIKSVELESSTIYDKFRLHFYTQIFSRFENREATLTTVESFSMDCIMAMDHPTVAEFAAMMNISAPNAAYRVNSLVQKGYLRKVQSKEDARIFYLEPSEKYMNYYRINLGYLDTVVARCRERFSDEDYVKLTSMLHIINSELMPELDMKRFRAPRDIDSKE